jgi:hypothetical protein
MRVLEAVSAGLSLTAAAIVTSVLVAGTDVQLLFLAAFCCVVVAIYQIVNFYLGYKLHQRIDQSRSNTPNKIHAAEENFGRLSAADTTPVVNPASVIENTTELLEPVPRKTTRDSS